MACQFRKESQDMALFRTFTARAVSCVNPRIHTFQLWRRTTGSQGGALRVEQSLEDYPKTSYEMERTRVIERGSMLTKPWETPSKFEVEFQFFFPVNIRA